jgi:glycogen debranching enzyme
MHETYVPNHLVEENVFRCMPREECALPQFETARALLPQPFWEGHKSAMACYWRAWELAFAHLRQPTVESGFVANFIDTAFNACLFMWDSAFILLFARYGTRAFNFQRTLDNLYARQHPDGYICREIREVDGQEMFARFDPASTGPNILPWAEWEYFQSFGDRTRLEQVLPCLLAYYQWFRDYRSWPDGSYWSCGWGCGMDNQPRVLSSGIHAANFSHGHMAWIDATLQQIFAGKTLLAMGRELGREADVKHVAAEVEYLSRFVNERMWNDATNFYCDRYRDGALSNVQSIGAYWALLAGVLPPERLPHFLAHLSDSRKFNRPHRIPSLAADDEQYCRHGDYWLGSVWAPTNYMVLRGLTAVSEHDLAHEIAVNHHRNVVEVFAQTETLWENYAPEYIAPGDPARPDFVGWSGLPPIAVLFEYIFGLRPQVPAGKLIWDVRLLEEHGVQQYPFGPDGALDLRCARRFHPADEPQIEFTSTAPVELLVRWPGGCKVLMAP